jgi:hypothetical protein
MTGMTERLRWCADLRAFKLLSMVWCTSSRSSLILILVGYIIIIIFLPTESSASMISMVFEDAPVYRYSMCNGTEYVFNMCQLPVPDSDSMCPSFATVNCTEGLHTIASNCIDVGIMNFVS